MLTQPKRVSAAEFRPKSRPESGQARNSVAHSAFSPRFWRRHAAPLAAWSSASPELAGERRRHADIVAMACYIKGYSFIPASDAVWALSELKQEWQFKWKKHERLHP